MKEKQKIVNYPSKNIKTESYKFENSFITKHYYDAKDAYVMELITEKEDVKEIKYFTQTGVLSKVENFVDGLRDGIESRYIVPKANKTIKSTKTYSKGKLHGECITYNNTAQIIKQEVYAEGKLVLKYLRNDSDNSISNIQIVNKESVNNLPESEQEKLKDNLQNSAEWFEPSV